MSEKLNKDESGNSTLQGIGLILALVIMVSLGGLLASAFMTASALDADSPFNVTTTISTYYPLAITIAFAAILAIIGIPVVGMILAYFGANRAR